MKAADFVLSLIHAAGGSVEGRTLLQKTAYFVSVLCSMTDEMGYEPHYYGPYSVAVDEAVTKLKSLGFVNEVTIGFGVLSQGFEVKRYDYRLTDDGREIVRAIKENLSEEYRRIDESVRRIRTAGGNDYVGLSIAAKAYFLLTRAQKPMARSEIVKEAKRFDWNISADSLDRAVAFLEQLNLVKGKG